MNEIKFPSCHDKNPERKFIARWITRKRRKKSQLSQDWIKRFEKFPGWSWRPISDRVLRNQEQLLEMAQKGEPKPVWKTRLGMLLRNYTNKSNPCYNAEFDRKIRKLAPQWFVNTLDENKKQLLEMAQKGEPRPHSKTKLGKTLCRYTNKSHSSFDAKFDKQIRKLIPQWFVNTADEKKTQLLEMARKGKPRPTGRTKIGKALCRYTNKNNRCYDTNFDKKIRKLAPQWFINTVKENKAQLLEMAQKGEPRPHSKTKLGIALYSYTNKSSPCYNAKFDKQIRKLIPQWSVNTADKKKEQLFEMAREGKPRPTQKTTLGQALYRYTNKSNSNYNTEFDKKIRKLAPQWFKS